MLSIDGLMVHHGASLWEYLMINSDMNWSSGLLILWACSKPFLGGWSFHWLSLVNMNPGTLHYHGNWKSTTCLVMRHMTAYRRHACKPLHLPATCWISELGEKNGTYPKISTTEWSGISHADHVDIGLKDTDQANPPTVHFFKKQFCFRGQRSITPRSR